MEINLKVENMKIEKWLGWSSWPGWPGLLVWAHIGASVWARVTLWGPTLGPLGVLSIPRWALSPGSGAPMQAQMKRFVVGLVWLARLTWLAGLGPQ